MIASAATTSARVRVRALPERLTAPVWVLSTIVVASSAARSVIAYFHTLPRYFPDEYIYASLSRSIGHGQLQVHGRSAHFPALLEPVIAAPIWRLFSIQTAYHLVQVENAIIGSLVVVPVYLLARELRLSRGYAYLACAYSVSLPLFVATAFVVTDFVAYPLVIAALLFGVRALAEPTAKRQLGFLGFTLVAMFARTQYFVLVPAYLAAATLVDGSQVLRRHRVTLIAIAPAALAVAVGALGYYDIGRHTFQSGIGTWILLETFLLAVASGIVIVPGAIAGIIRPGDRTRAGFGALASTFALLLMAEVAVFAAPEGQFRERYLFAILPLVALAFGVYLDRKRPHGWVVLAVIATLAVTAARLPLSNYVTGARFGDSQTLIAAEWLQDHWSVGSSSLLFALLITVGAVCAGVGHLRGGKAYVAVPVAICVLIAATAAATKYDRERTVNNRPYLPNDLSWIDHAVQGRSVTAIATPAGATLPLIEQLFWNPNVDREVVAPGGTGTDPYATQSLNVNSDGELANVGKLFLFDFSGTQATFANANALSKTGVYGLYRNDGGARVRSYVDNLLFTGWLSPDGFVRAWPTPGKRVRIVMKVSLPSGIGVSEQLRVGNLRATVHPGETTTVTCVANRAKVNVAYRSRPILYDSNARAVAVEASVVSTTDIGPARPGGPPSATCSAR